MHRTNWDDLRFVLAVVETGSVGAAARKLAVNHATILRRIAAFEEAHGIEVFARTARGYVVRSEQLPVIEAMRAAALAMTDVENAARATRQGRGGHLVITSTDTFCTAVLPEILSRVTLTTGAVELRCTNRHLDLGRLDADLTVRPGASLPQSLSGVPAGTLGFGVFAAAEGEDGPWLGLTGHLAGAGPGRWLAENVPLDQLGPASDSFLSLREMAAAGLGRTILPLVLGRDDARLRRLPQAEVDMEVPIWVACHKELEDVPRLRSARSKLAKALLDLGPRLAASG